MQANIVIYKKRKCGHYLSEICFELLLGVNSTDEFDGKL